METRGRSCPKDKQLVYSARNTTMTANRPTTLTRSINNNQIVHSHSIYALPEEGKTPQIPSGSSSPLAFPLSAICSLLTLLTSNPTVTGPIKVQSKIAQVTTRNSSEFPPSPNTPFASATELIRKPISPRETMALPKMAAG